jgi:hypothetical protein
MLVEVFLRTVQHGDFIDEAIDFTHVRSGMNGLERTVARFKPEAVNHFEVGALPAIEFDLRGWKSIDSPVCLLLGGHDTPHIVLIRQVRKQA